MSEAIVYLEQAENEIRRLNWTPTKELALSLTTAAREAANTALALPPVERNVALKDVADRLSAIETYFKKQGAELVHSNIISEERIRTIGLWGMEYSDLSGHGGDRRSDQVNLNVSLKNKARQRSGDISEMTASRFVFVGNHLDEISIWAEDNRELKHLTLGGFILEMRRSLPDTETPPLPEGQYRTIVADPPWPMVKIGVTEKGTGSDLDEVRRASEGRSIGYPTMSVDDIALLLVDVLKQCGPEDGGHFYLWTTQKYIRHAFQYVIPEIQRETEYKYRSTMVWMKPGGITFNSYQYNAEFALFLVKNNLPLAELGIKLAFEAPRQGHSIKPDEFFDIIKRASPSPRLELFARQLRDGFDTWGDEVGTMAN